MKFIIIIFLLFITNTCFADNLEEIKKVKSDIEELLIDRASIVDSFTEMSVRTALRYAKGAQQGNVNEILKISCESLNRNSNNLQIKNYFSDAKKKEIMSLINETSKTLNELQAGGHCS